MTETTISLDPAKVKKILVCQLRQIGDVMLSTPVAELLAQKYPHAEIHYFTEKKCVPVLQHNPYISKIWAVDKKELSNIFKEFAYYKKVAQQGYDLMVGLQHLPRIRWISYLCDAPVKLSYPSKWVNDVGYTHLSEHKSGYASESKVSILAPLGIEWNRTTPKLFLTPEEEADAVDLLGKYGVTSDDKLITVDPTHMRPTRQYPPKSYGKLISALAKQRSDLKFLLLAGPGEEQVLDEVMEGCDSPDSVIIPDPILSLREVAACQKHSVLHIGNCSAPRHIAVAVGTPTFVVLGSTGDAWRFPSEEHTTIVSDIECCPCGKDACSIGIKCLTELEPDRVAKSVLDHLKALGI